MSAAHAGRLAILGGGIMGWIIIRHDSALNIVERKKVIRGKKVKDWSRDMNR